MKYVIVGIIAVMSFVGLSSLVASYQIHDAQMVVANAESGAVDPTGPPSKDV